MQLHQLKPTSPRKEEKRIGRGGKRGKTSGKGGKGQTARAGNRPRPEMRDFIKKLPKLRGFGKNRGRTVNSERVLPEVLNLSVLEASFKDGDEVNPKTIVAVGAWRSKKGSNLKFKILGTGTLTKKLTISGCTISLSAKAKVEKAGGKVV